MSLSTQLAEGVIVPPGLQEDELCLLTDLPPGFIQPFQVILPPVKHSPAQATDLTSLIHVCPLLLDWQL